MNEVTFRRLTLDDSHFFHDAVALLNRTQGQGLFYGNYLADHVAKKDNFAVGAFLNARPFFIDWISSDSYPALRAENCDSFLIKTVLSIGLLK